MCSAGGGAAFRPRRRPESDKIGFDGVTPLSDAAVRALEVHRARAAAIGLASNSRTPFSRYDRAQFNIPCSTCPRAARELDEPMPDLESTQPAR
jgi:hypothetical protein